MVSQHALQVVSQHALQQVSGGGYPSMSCRFPGPHPGGKLRSLARGLAHTQEGVSRPTPRGVPAPGGGLLPGECLLRGSAPGGVC